jgi:hypothetical protein
MVERKSQLHAGGDCTDARTTRAAELVRDGQIGILHAASGISNSVGDAASISASWQ